MEENGSWVVTCPYCGTFNSFLEGTDNGTGTCVFCGSSLEEAMRQAGCGGSRFEDDYSKGGELEESEF